MKRILAVIISLTLVFAISGCKKDDKKEKKQHSVDVEYYAKLGQIPEYKYKLGGNIDEITSQLDELLKDTVSEPADDDYSSAYNKVELDDFSFLSYDNGNYYYNDEDKSIFAVVGLGTAYGFSSGTFTVEVKEALEKFTPKETDGKYDKIFFMPISDNYTSLEYEFGKNTVIFVFQDNALCATMICKSDYFAD